MRGDNTALGKQWAANYEKAMQAMANRGPKDIVGVEEHVDELYRVLGAPTRSP